MKLESNNSCSYLNNRFKWIFGCIIPDLRVNANAFPIDLKTTSMLRQPNEK